MKKTKIAFKEIASRINGISLPKLGRTVFDRMLKYLLKSIAREWRNWQTRWT